MTHAQKSLATYVEPDRQKRLDRTEAEAVLRDSGSWVTMYEAGFDGGGDFWVIEPAKGAEEAFEKALLQAGRHATFPWSDWLID